jgi:parallel beta-helix repeat protein
MKKTAFVTVILIGLLALGVFCVQPIKAEYQGNIAINADGNVTPATAPIKQTGIIYSLTSDIIGSVTVHTSSITLDGSGHIVSGVSLEGTLNVTVKNFAVTYDGGRIGISLSDASNNLIANNTVSGFWSIQAMNAITFAGIYVMGGNSNTITQNNLLYNLDGMEFIDTSYNLIVQNNITSSTVWSPYTTGICFCGASDNTIYRNSFVDNHYQVYSDSINAWDDGYLGNYWSDYKTRYPYAGKMDSSEIGTTPYVIDEKNKDRHPLTQPFDSALYAPKIPPKISILSPVNQQFNESSALLLFTVDKQVSWMGYSLDSQDNITISGNSTVIGLTNGLHNITMYANDTFGNMEASETINFTIDVPEPFPVPIAVAVAVAACVGLLLYFRKRGRGRST